MLHMLRAIPIYRCMAIKLLKDGYDRLEAVYMEFLWGQNDQGNAKVPLAAWTTISHPLIEGGLGIFNFSQQARLLKLRCASHILVSSNMEWAAMALDLMKQHLQLGPNQKEHKFWTPQEAMLLLLELKTASKTINVVLEAWFLTRQQIQFHLNSAHIPGHLTILQVCKLISLYSPT